jgi:hypothetical protein
MGAYLVEFYFVLILEKSYLFGLNTLFYKVFDFRHKLHVATSCIHCPHDIYVLTSMVN